jgi:hypothetical protein
MEHRICRADLPGSPGDVDTAELAGLAAAERPDNTRVLRVTQQLFGVQRAVVERRNLWQPGRTLSVKFIDGNPVVQERVREVADRWVQHVNLNFRWVGPTERADIRIAFLDDGSWSYVGTDALGVDAMAPTMNYGWLTANTPQEEYDRVVLHEFGHMLGMHHEHMSPAANVPWDVEAVYAYYARSGWSRADVNYNVLNKLGADITNFSAFDRDSIMLYAIPNSLTIGDYEVGWNRALSRVDKDFMRTQYPGRAEIVPLEVNGGPVAADLNAGEVDTYAFDMAISATVIATTEGGIDTVMTILGPNDPASVLVADDNRGKHANARIVKKLGPGRYWLTVNHGVNPTQGAYAVNLRTRRR